MYTNSQMCKALFETHSIINVITYLLVCEVKMEHVGFEVFTVVTMENDVFCTDRSLTFLQPPPPRQFLQ
jgi:hypothetical protein